MKRAIRQLTQIWLDATDRNAITAARVDQLLLADPSAVGESRPGRTRMTFVSPLGILFRVDSTSRMVRIVSVWNIKR